MNIKEIQNLIKFVSKSGVEEVKIEREDFKITIKTKKNITKQVLVEDLPSNNIIATQPVLSSQQEIVQETSSANSSEELENENHIVVKSPIIGTFYRKPSPDDAAFVEVGDVVKKGDVLCIVEAMKVMNEIQSDVAGEIVEILVEDANSIEYGQTLFKVRKS